MSLTSQLANRQLKLRLARIAAEAYTDKLNTMTSVTAINVADAIVLGTSATDSLDDLNEVIAELAYPTVTISAVVYQCVLPSVDFAGSTYTAEDVAADAALAALMLAAGSKMLSRFLVAAFSATNLTGVHPKTCVFTNATTGPETSWAWTFGDGGTSTLENPSHVYADAGTYNVVLTVKNAYMSDAETKTAYIVLS